MRSRFAFDVRAIGAGACLAVASAAPAAESSTDLSGRVFADFSNLDLSNDGVDSPDNGTGVDVKRFYLGVTHRFDDVWSVSLTTDFNYVSSDGETQLFIKKAYIQAKASDALVGRLGSADMPWIPLAEQQYGYRYVELTLIDRLKYGTSADWGVHGSGELYAGRFDYAVSVVNGGGYRNPTRTSSMDVEVRVAFEPLEHLTVAVGGYSGKLGEDVEGSATPAQHTATRVNALVGYVNGPARLGVEYFDARNWNQVTTPESDRAAGVSLWASWDFAARWGVFARFDSAKTSKQINPDLQDEYLNGGVAYRARDGIDIALVYKHETVDGGGTVTSANGTIGGLREGRYSEVGVWFHAVF